MPMKRSFTLSYGNSVSGGDSTPDEMQNNTKKVSPSEYVIRNILNYSKSLSTCKTQQTGTMFLVMN